MSAAVVWAEPIEQSFVLLCKEKVFDFDAVCTAFISLCQNSPLFNPEAVQAMQLSELTPDKCREYWAARSVRMRNQRRKKRKKKKVATTSTTTAATAVATSNAVGSITTTTGAAAAKVAAAAAPEHKQKERQWNAPILSPEEVLNLGTQFNVLNDPSMNDLCEVALNLLPSLGDLMVSESESEATDVAVDGFGLRNNARQNENIFVFGYERPKRQWNERFLSEDAVTVTNPVLLRALDEDNNTLPPELTQELVTDVPSVLNERNKANEVKLITGLQEQAPDQVNTQMPLRMRMFMERQKKRQQQQQQQQQQQPVRESKYSQPTTTLKEAEEEEGIETLELPQQPQPQVRKARRKPAFGWSDGGSHTVNSNNNSSTSSKAGKDMTAAELVAAVLAGVASETPEGQQIEWGHSVCEADFDPVDQTVYVSKHTVNLSTSNTENIVPTLNLSTEDQTPAVINKKKATSISSSSSSSTTTAIDHATRGAAVDPQESMRLPKRLENFRTAVVKGRWMDESNSADANVAEKRTVDPRMRLMRERKKLRKQQAKQRQVAAATEQLR